MTAGRKKLGLKEFSQECGGIFPFQSFVFILLSYAKALCTRANKLPLICANPDIFTSYASRTCSNLRYFICSCVRGLNLQI